VENIILIFSPEAPTLEEIASLVGDLPGLQVGGEPHGLTVGASDGERNWIARYYAEPLPPAETEFFENWPPALIPERADFLTIDYRHGELTAVKAIVVALAARYEFFVDLLNRSVYTSAAFVERCRLEPNWNWDGLENWPKDTYYADWPPPQSSTT
jgi:hypothetical protein